MNDLEQLAVDLTLAGPRAAARALPVVKKGADNIMRDWRDRATGLPHAPAYPYSITYDAEITATGAAAEIGPDKERRQGALGNLIEYGKPGQAPHNFGGQAADTEEPRFVEQMGVLGASIL